MNIEAVLAEHGIKSTAHRSAVCKALDTYKKPVAAQELIKKTGIDKVTVYRILQTFVDAGLVREIDLRQGKVLYELTNRPEHHHIVCTSCGHVEDVHECMFGALKKPVLKESGFAKITDHVMEFFGLCKACNAK